MADLYNRFGVSIMENSFIEKCSPAIKELPEEKKAAIALNAIAFCKSLSELSEEEFEAKHDANEKSSIYFAWIAEYLALSAGEYLGYAENWHKGVDKNFNLACEYFRSDKKIQRASIGQIVGLFE